MMKAIIRFVSGKELEVTGEGAQALLKASHASRIKSTTVINMGGTLDVNMQNVEYIRFVEATE